MAYTYNILLGRITKISGYEGAVTVKLEKNFTENIPELESVFLEVEGRPVPFLISDTEYSGADILRIRFDGYDSDTKVNEFIGCRIFLTASTEPENDVNGSKDYIGFGVFDQMNKLVGEIKDIIVNPGQILLSVISPDKRDILIPFHEDFILNIDRKNKVIRMNLPDGLIEIN